MCERVDGAMLRRRRRVRGAVFFFRARRVRRRRDGFRTSRAGSNTSYPSVSMTSEFRRRRGGERGFEQREPQGFDRFGRRVAK
jgi:hypothetical protein